MRRFIWLQNWQAHCTNNIVHRRSHGYFHSPSHSLSALLNLHSRTRRSLLRQISNCGGWLTIVVNKTATACCIPLTWDSVRDKQRYCMHYCDYTACASTTSTVCSSSYTEIVFSIRGHGVASWQLMTTAITTVLSSLSISFTADCFMQTAL